MSESAEFQRSLILALRGDAALSALVGSEVHESMPDERPDPAVVLGPSDGLTDRADGLKFWEETVQIDVFAQTSGEKLPVKRITSAIVAVCDGERFEIADPYALEWVEVEQARVFDGKEPGEMRGVVQVTGRISRKV